MDKPISNLPDQPVPHTSNVSNASNQGQERIQYLFRICARTERIHPLMRLLIKHRQGDAS